LYEAPAGSAIGDEPGEVETMHRLHLLRHAKSSYPEGVEDRDRPLSRRGREAARRVGESLPAALGRVDLVLCSAALRTRETAALALAGLAPSPRVVFEDALYLAGRAALLRRLRLIDESAGSVIVIGHNPGLHDLAVALAGAQQGGPGEAAKRLAAGYPTAALAEFAIGNPWRRLDAGGGHLVRFLAPRDLSGAEFLERPA